MKKTIILSLLAVVMAFVACSPINDKDEMGGSITADQIIANVIVEKINGKNVNKVMFECNSPINCQWTNGVTTVAGSIGEMQMLLLGDQIITLTGLCGDGSIITKEFPITIEDIYYDVAPEYELLCGTGEKVWVWDDTVPHPTGNGGYLIHTAPAWWAIDLNGIDEQAQSNNIPLEGRNGTMTLTLSGMKLTKSGGDEGKFSFDMSKTTVTSDGTWAIGKLYTNNVEVLLGFMHSTNEYDILKLDENTLHLASPDPGAGMWGGCWYWCFKAQ